MKKLFLLLLLFVTSNITSAATLADFTMGYAMAKNNGDLSTETAAGGYGKIGIGADFDLIYIKLLSQIALLNGDVESGDLYSWGIDVGFPLGPLKVWAGYDLRYVYFLDGFQPTSGTALRCGISYKILENISLTGEYTIGVFNKNGGATITDDQGLNLTSVGIVFHIL